VSRGTRASIRVPGAVFFGATVNSIVRREFARSAYFVPNDDPSIKAAGFIHFGYKRADGVWMTVFEVEGPIGERLAHS